ncbi:patatin-like phospholipase family protein [Halovulum dunhuangense]|uniref:Patatin-like phospholipase family protein n=1 Tax=Halovulum dunhuangense TaxID=1505036 RepID=A0A849L2Z6_9RHOB|nr:patatin-like phospholipase family protein [Halovulum dunhuangense]NNU80728.1 patatin-like phospholipase family protein [Halovulum dunhuangense]
MSVTRINLALQGGGAHGAFTWGVLDRLLEDESLEIEGITATSAGAMNAAALKAGWLRGGHAGARAQLAAFWEEISAHTALPDPMLQSWLAALAPDPVLISGMIEASPAWFALDTASRLFSPYQTNPLGIHPLRPVVEKMLDFDMVCAADGPKLFVAATNVRSGKVRIFSGAEISPDALLASACLPTLYQAVEIDDPATGRREAYWDGGYMGNPALFPLFYETRSEDILIVHINPIHRETLPRTATEIQNRINEISFNSSLLRGLRAIAFAHRLLAEGHIAPGSMKDVRIHQVMDDALMTKLGVATKLTPNRALLLRLRDAGRARMDAFLAHHRDDLGRHGTVDLRELYD